MFIQHTSCVQGKRKFFWHFLEYLMYFGTDNVYPLWSMHLYSIQFSMENLSTISMIFIKFIIGNFDNVTVIIHAGFV